MLLVSLAYVREVREKVELERGAHLARRRRGRYRLC